MNYEYTGDDAVARTLPLNAVGVNWQGQQSHLWLDWLWCNPRGHTLSERAVTTYIKGSVSDKISGQEENIWATYAPFLKQTACVQTTTTARMTSYKTTATIHHTAAASSDEVSVCSCSSPEASFLLYNGNSKRNTFLTHGGRLPYSDGGNRIRGLHTIPSRIRSIRHRNKKNTRIWERS